MLNTRIRKPCGLGLQIPGEGHRPPLLERWKEAEGIKWCKHHSTDTVLVNLTAQTCNASCWPRCFSLHVYTVLHENKPRALFTK